VTEAKPGNWYTRRRAAKKRRLAAMPRRRRVFRRIAILGTWFLSFVAVLVVVASVAFYQLTKVPHPTDLKFDQAATIEYSDGSVMTKIGTTNRTDVTIKQIAPNLIWAVLAAEDRNFYSESGISLRGTVRAALNDLKGGDTQGGSGITQQYVKNAYLSDSRTLKRKLQELAISVKLDHEYSKDQILDWYLNTIYFGRGAYGIQAAAQTYFGKGANTLLTSESAMLAGMIQAPSDYDPAIAPDLTKQRWNYVLDGMVKTGHLSASERASLSFPTDIEKQKSNQFGIEGPRGLIVGQVESELSEDGISASTLATAGLTIRTTINHLAQTDAENAIGTAYGNPNADQANLKQALVAVNPASGAVVAYYGGKDGTGYDYAQAWRQPGSSFKPYTLATALQQTVNGTGKVVLTSVYNAQSPATIEGQQLYNDPSDPQSGFFTLTQSMTASLNTVFATLAHQSGDTNVAKTAHTMGIPPVRPGTTTRTLQDDGTTDYRIGIGGYEVRPIDQAVGFATLADRGVEHGSYFIASVTNSARKVLYTHKLGGTQAISNKVANDTTLSMEQVAGSSGLALNDRRTVASKTGTVGIGNTANNSDAWTVGFTPQISVASWVGSDSLAPIYNNSGGAMYGRNNPGTAWTAFMNSYLAGSAKATMPSVQEVFPNGGPTLQPTTVAPTTPATSTATTTKATTAPRTTTPRRTSTPPRTTTPRRTTNPPTTTVPRTPPTTTAAPPTSAAPPATSAADVVAAPTGGPTAARASTA
jgi:membrane peptidoglycan carboxypeptidase